MNLDQLLKELLKNDGSDLHLKVGRPPLMRIRGDLLPTKLPPVTKSGMEELLFPILTENQKNKLIEERELDFSYLIEGISRFRGAIFFQSGFLSAVFRAIPMKIQTLDDLGHPPILKELIMAHQGLILITGPTGSGKSTTLAALVDYLNCNTKKHIITIEDPLEFVHNDKLCTINQREVGCDTSSFFMALKRALRADPDVILVGEMRDPETIQTALTASETGHLVLSTLHTNYAKQSISRIIDAFPPDQHHHIRIRTAASLVATVAQRLVKRSDGKGRIALIEIMINTPTIRKLISEDKLDQIDKMIAESAHLYKMQTMNQHLFQLVIDDVLTKEHALSDSHNPNDLRIMLQTQAVAVKKEEEKKKEKEK
jgi:twitching motility protein PilT